MLFSKLLQWEMVALMTWPKFILVILQTQLRKVIWIEEVLVEYACLYLCYSYSESISDKQPRRKNKLRQSCRMQTGVLSFFCRQERGEEQKLQHSILVRYIQRHVDISCSLPLVTEKCTRHTVPCPGRYGYRLP